MTGSIHTSSLPSYNHCYDQFELVIDHDTHLLGIGTPQYLKVFKVDVFWFDYIAAKTLISPTDAFLSQVQAFTMKDIYGKVLHVERMGHGDALGVPIVNYPRAHQDDTLTIMTVLFMPGHRYSSFMLMHRETAMLTLLSIQICADMTNRHPQKLELQKIKNLVEPKQSKVTRMYVKLDISYLVMLCQHHIVAGQVVVTHYSTKKIYKDLLISLIFYSAELLGFQDRNPDMNLIDFGTKVLRSKPCGARVMLSVYVKNLDLQRPQSLGSSATKAKMLEVKSIFNLRFVFKVGIAVSE
ncbi:hypothetical protein EDD85DRAFT_798834 [Armillaria nabsnona]|nr:hypothetical protein EDD85DRAFT_798834 [Armillaria nabsnona]